MPARIEYLYGNILDSTTDCIGHGVNCRRAFGGGLAGQIAKKYPFVRQQYLKKYNAEGWKVGEIQPVYILNEGKFIVNMATQYSYGYMGVHVNYNAVRECCNKVFQACEELSLSISLPHIGAGLAGGDWSKIHNIIKEEVNKFDILLQIWDWK